MTNTEMLLNMLPAEEREQIKKILAIMKTCDRKEEECIIQKQ